jgi:hypothetical protein
MLRILFMVALSAAALLGADVAGKWTGKIEMMRDGEARSVPALLILEKQGDAYTGTVGPEDGERFPIKNVRLEGSKLTMDVQRREGESDVKVELQLDGDDHMTGEAKGESGDGPIHAKLDLKRVK